MYSQNATQNTSHYEHEYVMKLCIFLGIFGVHRYYVKRRYSGILYQLTFGLYFIGWISDILKLRNGDFVDCYGQPIIKDQQGPKPQLSSVSDSTSTALLLICMFGGWLGIHRLYTGKIVYGAYPSIVIYGFAFVIGILTIFTGSFDNAVSMVVPLLAILLLPHLILWFIDFFTILFEQYTDAEGRKIRNPKQTRYDRKIRG